MLTNQMQPRRLSYICQPGYRRGMAPPNAGHSYPAEVLATTARYVDHLNPRQVVNAVGVGVRRRSGGIAAIEALLSEVWAQLERWRRHAELELELVEVGEPALDLLIAHRRRSRPLLIAAVRRHMPRIGGIECF